MTSFKQVEQAVIDSNSSKKKLTSRCEVNDVQVFSGNAIWDVMAKKIENATSNVSICGYKFYGESKSGKKILDALVTLRKKSNSEHPITVDLLINKRGKWAEKFYNKNDHLGLDDFIKENQNYPHFKFNLKQHEAQALNSYHAKQMIVDAGTDHGEVMCCGGDIHRLHDDPNKQYETAILLTGKEVADIARQDFQDSLEPQASNVVTKQSNEKTNDFLTASLNAQTKIIPDSGASSVNASNSSTSVIYLSSQAKALPIEGKEQAPYKIAVLKSIYQAKKSINILTSNLNDPDVIVALADAANRGVKIKIAMSKHKNDHTEKFFGGTNESGVKRIDALIQPQNKKNFRVHWSVNPETTKLVKADDSYTMHGKFCMVDENILLMGSSPLDRQSMVCSREIDVCLNLENQKGQAVLHKIFYTPYAFGRDYYVDQVIQELNQEIIRLTKKNTMLSRTKALALDGLVRKLSGVGITPYDAYEILNSSDTKKIKDKMKDKEHAWNVFSTRSEAKIETCYKIIENCCTNLEQVKSPDDIDEAAKMQKIRNSYFNQPKPDQKLTPSEETSRSELGAGNSFPH